MAVVIHLLKDAGSRGAGGGGGLERARVEMRKGRSVVVGGLLVFWFVFLGMVVHKINLVQTLQECPPHKNVISSH